MFRAVFVRQDGWDRRASVQLSMGKCVVGMVDVLQLVVNAQGRMCLPVFKTRSQQQVF